MQVLCKSTTGNAEMHCSVCGQGFVMFREIQTTLRRQHRDHKGPEAHPNGSFLVPDWNGSTVTLGIAAHGQAPSWAL
jgi:hypothetical protein